jgi:hypothetical protein
MISDLCFINKFLDTDDLNKFARSNNAISRFYLGCYPANVQPKNITNNCCWIWNTDEQGDSGTHWVAVWKQRNKFVFFDSYGKLPSFYNRKYWELFAREIGCRFMAYSSIQRQSMVSKTCGIWCLFFLYECCFNFINNNEHNFLLKTVFTQHIKDLIHNETVLKRISHQLFDNVSSVYKRKCRSKDTAQRCCNFMTLLERNKK